MSTKLTTIALSLLALCAAIAAPQETYGRQQPDSDPQRPAEKDLAGYLFVYFTGNHISQEAICMAISTDGFTFRALNGGRPVLDSKIISSTGGVRDPHILRAEDGRTFYMVATDMVSDNGWDSNRAMVLLRSDDLVNWTHSVVNMQKRYEGQERLKRVWAPQTIYDAEAGKYMIYWSMKHGDGPDIIYYAYANDSFTDLEGEPRPLFVPANRQSCIDGDIVFKDGTYHLFYKTEGHGNGIKVATTRSLTSGVWEEQPDYKQQTADAVEGAGTFKLIGQDKYILMYDVYMKGRYQFTESVNLRDFKVIDSEVDMDFHPRHGTVIPVTAAEMRHLAGRWGVPDGIDIPRNPVLEGFHADPEILYSEKTGRYYIYSTTDGTEGWGGWYFTCYSSADLTEWRYEGVALDLGSEQVAWADGNAWAPCIEEVRMRDGGYKYYFYYSGNPAAGGGKQIGVAVADDPAGPFIDSRRPIVTESPAGGGQQIDVDVFTDPVSGKRYLYWGNGYMAGAELTKDMLAVKPRTVTVMTPEGGTLDDYAYREAPYVFHRDGIYYFLWSVDDTGSPNYHIAYGTSRSPLGPIEVAADPVVLIQRPDRHIYGTGHCSVIRLPDSDEWRIVYHRINPSFIGNGPGIHREVCIDRMEFNADGTIRRVEPTN